MEKYNYQIDAIDLIENDFIENHKAKNLLVIPTGGGKTLTALRAVDRLIKNDLINESDSIVWAVHSIPLKEQTKDVLEGELLSSYVSNLDRLKQVMQICMIEEARKISKNKALRDKVKLIIIDGTVQ